jgi:hypothetical protein
MIGALVMLALTVPGWRLAGSNAKAFEVAVDHTAFRSGRASAMIRCRDKRCEGFGTLSQSVRADRYIGRRIRLTGWVKAKDAERPRLWMRVDGHQSQLLAFDNMDGRARSGSFDWKRQEIVLDVMPAARVIHFGLILGSGGQAWLDDIVLEVADDAESTDMLKGPVPAAADPEKVQKAYDTAPSALVNGDFEQAP